MVHTHTNPPRGGQGVSPLPPCFLGPYLGSGCPIVHTHPPLLPGGGEGSHCSLVACWAPVWTAVMGCATVHGLWQLLAERPLQGLLIVAGFSIPMLGNSTALRHPHLFSDPGYPETTLSHLGFCPTLPPEDLSGRDVPYGSKLLKVLIWHFAAISLSSGQL